MQQDAARTREVHRRFGVAVDWDRDDGCRCHATTDPPRRIQIQHVEPQVDHGRLRRKRTPGERVEVSATIFRDGHEILGAAVRAGGAGERRWRESLMYHAGNDRWVGHLELDACGRWEFAVAAWVDRFASWRYELQRKVDAGAGGPLRRAVRGRGAVRRRVADGRGGARERRGRPLRAVDARRRSRSTSTASARASAPGTSSSRARGAASRGVDGGAAATSRSSASTSSTCRPSTRSGDEPQGPQQHARRPTPSDPGSPWAIGSEEGGHDAINPELGTLEEFDAMVARGARARRARSASTSRSSARPTTRGSRSTRSGSTAAPTGR